MPLGTIGGKVFTLVKLALSKHCNTQDLFDGYLIATAWGDSSTLGEPEETLT
jgi:hypothetical protein